MRQRATHQQPQAHRAAVRAVVNAGQWAGVAAVAALLAGVVLVAALLGAVLAQEAVQVTLRAAVPLAAARVPAGAVRVQAAVLPKAVAARVLVQAAAVLVNLSKQSKSARLSMRGFFCALMQL